MAKFSPKVSGPAARIGPYYKFNSKPKFAPNVVKNPIAAMRKLAGRSRKGNR